MNYAYQTIAHNTVTVKDPDDTVPAPRKDNHHVRLPMTAGKRRIGSGWGIEAAPLDLQEWRKRRDLYQTGSMERIFIEDDLVIAVADLTPAYTNSLPAREHFRIEHVGWSNSVARLPMTGWTMCVDIRPCKVHRSVIHKALVTSYAEQTRNSCRWLQGME